MIGVLREGDDGVEPPQPTLDAIPALIEESRAAGMRVRVADRGRRRRGHCVGRTAYRVVQEGLTNARKHAPAAAVEVTVAADEALVVEVVSRRSALAPGAVAGRRHRADRARRARRAGRRGARARPEPARRLRPARDAPWP